jgi:hypothetical protein
MAHAQCPRHRTPLPRHGVALVPVVVLVSAVLLVALAFTDAVLHAMRGARLGWQGERATHEADAALLASVAAWDRGTAASLHPGEGDTLAAHLGEGVRSGVVRTRLHARLFALEAWADVQDGGIRSARRAVGRTVRLDWPRPPVHGALTSGGAVALGDSADVLGADAVPAGWDAECALDRRSSPIVAVAARSASVALGAVVSGAGASVQPLADSTAFAAEFDAAFAELARLADARTEDPLLSLDLRSAVAPSCPVWLGEGARGGGVSPACSRRWPILHATAPDSVQLVGTTPAQGILLVDGDLILRGRVSVFGLVLVRGRLLAASSPDGQRPILTGAVVVRDAGANGSPLPALRLQGSLCAVRRALAAAGDPVPIGVHGWGERP